MKKILLLILIMLVSPLGVLAESCDYSCVKPYDMSSSVGRFFTTVTGVNFLGNNIAKSIIKKEIKKTADSKLTVSMKSFGLVDLMDGRFKSMSIKAKNISADGIYLESLNLETLCEFNYIIFNESDKTMFFKEDFPMKFSMTMSDQDLNKTMSTIGYEKMISDMNKAVNKYKIRILDMQTKIQNDRFLYIIKMSLPLLKAPQHLIVSSDLTVKYGEIRFADTKILSESFVLDLSKLSYALNYLNPLDYSLKILENKDARLKVDEVLIKDNKITIEGIVIIPKDVVTQQ